MQPDLNLWKCHASQGGRTAVASEIPSRPSLVRWGPSFAGAIAALAIGAMFSALWWAIAYGSGVGFVAANFSWFFLATVLAALLIGGTVAGRVSGLRGARVGLWNGFTVWGLAVVGALIPLSLRGLALANTGVTHPARATALSISSGDAWALFGAIIGGLACALVGGFAGCLGRPEARPDQRIATTIPERHWRAG